jgi:uncharacterized protein YehS (DUF1456 family)
MTVQASQNDTFLALSERQAYFQLAEDLQQKYASQNLTKNLQFEYSFITIKLIQNLDNQIVTWLSVSISKQFNVLEVWCKEQNLQAEIENLIKKFEKSVPPKTNSKWLQLIDNEPIKKYLAEADQIAKLALYCSSGDNYVPFFYSKIIITENGILLEQINHYNAKSLDKDNYVLRNLRFYTPFKDSQLTDNEVPTEFAIYKYQNLIIQFSDHSSANYRQCGERIEVAIKKLIRQ